MINAHAFAALLCISTSACAGAAAQPGAARAVPRAPALTTAASAALGDDAVAPDRDAAAIAALRAAGPAGLRDLFAAYDAAPTAALASTIDRVAAQRYATVSRLYWYTDLDGAKAAARSSGKPILSLRLLGRLDEDRSCANSRFFRTALYSDPAVATLLREKFVLHWSSERDIPRVTIAFPDGRRIESTVTGNSLHAVLDADGQVIDALPGLYMPPAFVVELGNSLELATSLVGKAAAARAALIQAYQGQVVVDARAAWAAASGTIALPTTARLGARADVESLLAAGQRASMSKAMIEVPMLTRLSAGTDPGKAPDDVRLWGAIGEALYGIGGLTLGPTTARLGSTAALVPRDQASPPHILGPATRALMTAVHGEGGPTSPDVVIDRFELSMAADTAKNELALRPQIAQRLTDGPMTFDAFTAWVYPEVFAMPRDDAWLGLLPRTDFTGLPDDGVVR